MEEFEEMCIYHQTSPDSHFTQKRLCTLATADGRMTLTDLTLIESARGQRTETMLADEAEWQKTLREFFDVVL